MLDRFSDLVEKAELAVASSSGVIDDEQLQPLVDLLKTIRARMSYPDEVLIVALAGGTGSGKSSLFNALAGADLVDVGGIRPTTAEPAAGVPRAIGHRIDGFLDHLGIGLRYQHDGPPICVIDLPDTDSVETEHRLQVNQIIPYADAVVWVTDPEKYRDARLHHDYLAPLADYSAGFVVVLNQVDRLDPSYIGEVLTDLEAALRADGLANVVLVPVAAAPPAGPPIGLDSLVDTLETMRELRQVVSDKLMTDLATTARTLASGAGPSVEFDARARKAVADAVARLEEKDATSAVSDLAAFVDQIGTEIGGPSRQVLAQYAADVPAHVSRIVSEIDPPTRRRRWFRRRPQSSFDTGTAMAKLNSAVIRPIRAELARRAVAVASIADLAVEVESLRDPPPR